MTSENPSHLIFPFFLLSAPCTVSIFTTYWCHLYYRIYPHSHLSLQVLQSMPSHRDPHQMLCTPKEGQELSTPSRPNTQIMIPEEGQTGASSALLLLLPEILLWPQTCTPTYSSSAGGHQSLPSEPAAWPPSAIMRHGPRLSKGCLTFPHLNKQPHLSPFHV